MLNDWISFALNGVSGAAAIVCLFDGVRRIGAQGASGTAVVMAVLGGLFCASYGGLAYWQYRIFSETTATLTQQIAAADRPREVAKDLTPERRERLSLATARARFLEHGALTTHVDRAGAEKLFAPSQAEIKRRETFIAARAQMVHAARDNLSEAVQWWAWGVIAALFGFAFAREKSPRRSNPAA